MDALEQSLAHFGVKGMKWGVRRNGGAAPTGSTPVTAHVVAGKKVKTSGGQKHLPHEDAIAAAVGRQRAKKSSTDSLSNKELQMVVQRMNLERQYSSLKSDRANPFAKFVTQVIIGTGKQQMQRVANDTAAEQVGNLLKKTK